MQIEGSDSMTKEAAFGESAEMYLKTIAELADMREFVPITSIAERLGISTVSASEMIRRLQDHGLLRHTPYKGVQLTKHGTNKANLVIRNHRLWEIFLVDKLGIAWEKAHEHACRLEHAVNDEVIDALDRYLEHPESCPHGNPIPDPKGKMPRVAGTRLIDFDVSESGIILRILPNDDYDVLCSYLAVHDIKPGGKITVVEIAPFDGPISVRLGSQVHALGRNIAQQIVLKREKKMVEAAA
jgi:DtxR family Mn-dependent transcriptional regulator